MTQSKAIQEPRIFQISRLFSNLRGDLTGGLTAAVVALPLALAFAVASGVEPKAGVYTAIVAGIIAAIFGGSPVQITGPTGAMAVILVGIVAKYGIEKVWIAGVMAGVIQVALGVAKLGQLVKFIPYPVTAGFTNGIAVIIFCGQLNNFFGLKLPRSDHFLPGIWQTVSHIEGVNWAAVGLVVVAIAGNVLWPKINNTIPGSLVGLVLATGIASYFHLDVPKIGAIPQSLPMLQTIPHWNDFSLIRELINPALALAALGSIESLLSAVVADGMTVSEKHNSDRELIGQGLANIIVPFFGGIPATGAIARTAVNVRSGGKTRLSGVIHGVALAIIILTLAPLASQIPLAALAGILMVVSLRMIEWEAISLLFRATYSDFAVMILTWLVTILFDLVLAVEIGLIAAGALFIKRMSDLSLAKIPETEVFPPGIPLELGKEIAVYRVDGPVFFGAAERFVTFLREQPEVKYLILRLRFVPNMDTTGLVALEDIYQDLKRQNCRLILTGLQPQVQQLLQRSGLLAKIGLSNCFETTTDAIYSLSPEINSNTEIQEYG
ncbi:SulP family inorganic anion transporter [Anabaena cylindrica FACHB-243]|uniref:Sulfate transporter n=1 Tax=Anabaena cylindrica (strain ATCC 27899 / PCC 7122) TaxID=272123 RepID=K9ZDB9_ANACC|nr:MULTISPECIES: SulP family inorganic anion transporter [Anabaena]AFZ56370.1 sulfate transporter [Anabaena cylindrica PCC 7122]MBD2418181.1 SulP family inorganic anion transporter [Anabaena cylindrica FACHB-243]MBY5283818.1 SulP family inorganic anion transporter [Anabaena sp. CCAP 1446/1C]MBY5309297.1 SulP family inorganic anion transporter [Anabaena sp. CCAP 1446/1C]MCM2409097.1 SulP family inorganic anion transporter [Anabaena sp. CCAP 1446/1C]